MIYHRRAILGFGAAAGLIALPGCSSLPGLSLTEAVKRLLTLSSQNAFAELMQPDGFFDSQVARIAVPDSLGGSRVTSVATALLRSKAIQDRLLKQVNRAAETGAELAAPIVAETIRNMSVADATAIINGGPRAATSLLQRQLGNTLVERILPGIGNGLKLFDNEIINLVLSQATNVDFSTLSRDVANQVSDAIYRSIGAQEESIRANPRATNDPLLIAVLGVGKAF
ncbi:DUF4197 domain-containing protein [Parasphingorhabdus sp.]|uniref:DUF4197 domain-containing protein n=1 Tax=Parasphingorhabdus sp. TaxID=2709688 RepID=UPI003A9460ED